MSRLWMYKCNAKNEPHQTSWGRWDYVFRLKREIRWGGSDSTRNKRSMHILNDEIAAGDVVLAYQTDERSIYGTCRVTRVDGPRNKRKLWLQRRRKFRAPILIHDLKTEIPELLAVECLKRSFPQMLYPVTDDERRVLERACGAPFAVLAPRPPVTTERIANGGAGFGTAAQNKKVELAAVTAVCEWYQNHGWQVRSVEASRCGFDIKVTDGKRSRHVEVKGVTGAMPSFVITNGEVTAARRNPNFFLCVVLRALSKSPEIRQWTGAQFLAEFNLKPLQFLATPKERGNNNREIC
jgi:hypothetical protein